MQDQQIAYFCAVFDWSVGMLSQWPIPATPSRLADIAYRIEPALTDGAARHVGGLHEPPTPPNRTGKAIGLNTVGLLSDRLSILAVKTWMLRNRYGKPTDSHLVASIDAGQIIGALAAAYPSGETLVSKITKLSVKIDDRSWASSYYGLLSSNLLMWEAQEWMYINNMEDCTADEIRACLSFCSLTNLKRNHYIAACERCYWRRPD